MMARRASLSARLAIRILLVQLLVLVAWMLAWMTMSPYVSYEELAAASAQRRVAASVEPSELGALRIVPTPSLTAYTDQRPGFAYAAMRDGIMLPGSDPALAIRLASMGGAVPMSGALTLKDGVAIHADAVATAHGPLVVLTMGNRFGREDLATFFTAYLPQLIGMFGPAILAACLIAVPVIRRALAPVRTAAGAATAIDIGSLDRRIPEAGLPQEILPFVTAINRLLARLQEGVAAQRVFAASAAHELRTPLSILSARIDELPEGRQKTGLRRDAVRMAILVDQLMAVARVGSQANGTAGPVPLTELVRDIVADLAPLAYRSGRALALDAGTERVDVLAEPAALRSAIANLIENAIRAEPEGGTIQLRLQPDGCMVVLEVEDHGVGIAAEDAAHVFEPFWRKSSTGPGSGLGLAITRGIAEACGGSVMHVPTPGGGATFRLALPLAPANGSADCTEKGLV
jgi:signal transduction histidine kinase